jgi:hypothetical protein
MYLGRTSLDPAPDLISENFVDPNTAGTFTWVNQGSATISEVPGNDLMLVPAGGGVNNLRMRSILTPLSGPFTITMAFQPFMNNDTFQAFGIILRDSTGRAYLWGLNYNAGWQWVRYYWNSPSSYNSDIRVNTHFNNSKPTSIIWVRIVNDGSLLRLQTSLDNGNTFIEQHTDAQFGFLSDFDEYGFGGSASFAADFYCNVVGFEAI